MRFRIAIVIFAVVCADAAFAQNWVSDPSDPNNVKIEAAIRKVAEKPSGELTKADLEKVTRLDIWNAKLTDVKGLEKLTQLVQLDLRNNLLTDVRDLENLTKLTELRLTLITCLM